MGRLSSTSTRGSQGKRRRKQPSGERGENGGASATGRPGADVFFASAAHTKPAHKQPGLEGPAQSTSHLASRSTILRPPSPTLAGSAVERSHLASCQRPPRPSPLWSAAAWSLQLACSSSRSQPAAGQPSNPLSRRLGSKSPRLAGSQPAAAGARTICSAPGPYHAWPPGHLGAKPAEAESRKDMTSLY